MVLFVSVMEKVKLLQGLNNVGRIHPRRSHYLSNRSAVVVVALQVIENNLLPVRVVRQTAKLRERFFWRARLFLRSRQQVTEIDQELAIPVDINTQR